VVTGGAGGGAIRVQSSPLAGAHSCDARCLSVSRLSSARSPLDPASTGEVRAPDQARAREFAILEYPSERKAMWSAAEIEEHCWTRYDSSDVIDGIRSRLRQLTGGAESIETVRGVATGLQRLGSADEHRSADRCTSSLAIALGVVGLASSSSFARNGRQLTTICRSGHACRIDVQADSRLALPASGDDRSSWAEFVGLYDARASSSIFRPAPNASAAIAPFSTGFRRHGRRPGRRRRLRPPPAR